MPVPINVVVDLSHHNGTPNLKQAAADGIVGVIHKATQGFKGVDPMYRQNRKQAEDAGLLWGAYHFGVLGDGSDQADHFLEIAQADKATLLVLDYEPNPSGGTMSLDQAREFVAHLDAVLGRFPGFYSGHLIKQQLGNQPADPVLAQCFLWIAQYGPKPILIPPTWPTWTLWQYTDGSVGPDPHSVKGIGFCDRDRFNGGLANLKKLWGAAS